MAKAGIHPKYDMTTITCACGTVYHVGSTRKSIKVEVCSNCHPFYTGSRSLRVEQGGRIERFRKKYGLA